MAMCSRLGWLYISFEHYFMHYLITSYWVVSQEGHVDCKNTPPAISKISFENCGDRRLNQMKLENGCCKWWCMWLYVCGRNVTRHSRRPASLSVMSDIVTPTRNRIGAPSATTHRWNWASWGGTSGRTPANVRTSVRTARTPAPTRTNSNDISVCTPEKNRTSVIFATCGLHRATVSRWVLWMKEWMSC